MVPNTLSAIGLRSGGEMAQVLGGCRGVQIDWLAADRRRQRIPFRDSVILNRPVAGLGS